MTVIIKEIPQPVQDFRKLMKTELLFNVLQSRDKLTQE